MPWSNETCAPQLLSLRSRASEPQLLSPCATATEARAPRACAPQQEKAHTQQRRPNAAKKKDLILFIFLAALGLRCCVRVFSSCGERGLLFVVVHGLLIMVASLVAEHRL